MRLPSRTRSLLGVALAAAVLGAGCDRLTPFGCDGCTVPPSELAAIPLTPGLSLHQVRLSNGREMDLAVAVPAGYRGGPLPLVLALHFATEPIQPASLDYLRIHAEPGLRDLGALIIAPDNINIGLTWGDLDTQDIAISLLDAALEAWPIEPDQVVVTGYSDGAIGAWWLADRFPDRFRAAIPVAGIALGSFDGGVPVYAVHGRNDSLFPLSQVEATITRLQDQGLDVSLHVTEWGHFEPSRYTEALAEAAAWVEALP
jgi:pimeloyl-ACP methyl ester carboxylesterase